MGIQSFNFPANPILHNLEAPRDRCAKTGRFIRRGSV